MHETHERAPELSNEKAANAVNATGTSSADIDKQNRRRHRRRVRRIDRAPESSVGDLLDASEVFQPSEAESAMETTAQDLTAATVSGTACGSEPSLGYLPGCVLEDVESPQSGTDCTTETSVGELLLDSTVTPRPGVGGLFDSASQPRLGVLSAAHSAVMLGEDDALSKALEGVDSLATAPKPPAGTHPLLHAAAFLGHAACIHLLIQKGAEVEAKSHGKTALQLARERGHVEAARVLEAATTRRHDEQAVALVGRQSEAALRAAEAESSLHRGIELAEAVFAARRAQAAKPSLKSGASWPTMPKPLASAASWSAMPTASDTATKRGDQLMLLACAYLAEEWKRQEEHETAKERESRRCDEHRRRQQRQLRRVRDSPSNHSRKDGSRTPPWWNYGGGSGGGASGAGSSGGSCGNGRTSTSASSGSVEVGSRKESSTGDTISRWLCADGTRELLNDLAESLPSDGPPNTSGTELALAIRVAQLRLREAASAAAGKPLGQDELVPLLERLIVHAQPSHARSVLDRMRRGISEEELLKKPDLASAVDGWDLACEGVERQALDAWRSAHRTASFFRALRRSPNALLMAACEPNTGAPLEDIFRSFLRELVEAESKDWQAATSVEEYVEAVQRSVTEMLPDGEDLCVQLSTLELQSKSC